MSQPPPPPPRGAAPPPYPARQTAQARGAADQQATYILPSAAQPNQRGKRQGRWFHGLRFRLIATYALVLAGVLLVLGIALSIVIGRVLYTEELARIESEAQASVALEQATFDRLVAGQAANNCADAISYQEAFGQTVGSHLAASYSGVRSVYLLSRAGDVLAPTDATPAAGQPGPYITRAHINQLYEKALAARQPVTGSIAAISYLVTSGTGGRQGVVLVAERFRTASVCVRKSSGAYGIVEVVTAFPRAQVTLDVLHLVVFTSLLGALVAGIVIGGPLIGQALRPLTRVTQAAHRIASGDLSQRVRLPHSDDEIGQLTATFDEMAGRIEAAFGAQAASEERMRQFIADASHELRTPLTSIRGYLDVLLRGAKDDPATTEQVLQATRREAERMTRLVTDLLTLARLDAGRPLELQPVDIIALAGDAVDQARILAGEREVMLRTDGAGRLIVPVDSDRLRQVLLILMDNALKYGRATPDAKVRVRVWRTPQAAMISVTDNGPGIAPADLSHIFDRFYRAQRAARRRVSMPPGAPGQATPHDVSAREGTGLGLSIAYAIIRAHGGTLAAQSQPGTETTFTITLPLPAGLSATPTQPSPPR